MIQTQLLKLDPPYQIISARGYVGIQVGTLIVAKEYETVRSRLGNISNYIEFHSYPVVSYGLKQGIEEDMKYYNNPLDEVAEYQIRRRMQPEGAVWSGVEVKDVRVLGIAGAKNSPVELDYFVYLVPTVPGFDPHLHVWDEKSTSRIYELYDGLGNVGIKTPELSNIFLSDKNNFPIKLMLEPHEPSGTFFVKVIVREDLDYPPYDPRKRDVIFRCLVDPANQDSIKKCATTIVEAIRGISWFLPSIRKNITMGNIAPEYAEAMEHLTSLVKENV